MSTNDTYRVALVIDILKVEVIRLEQLQFAHHLLEQIVTIRLHLKRETIQDMSHWAYGRVGGRQDGRDPRTGSNRTPSPEERNNTRHESLGVCTGGWAAGWA